MSLRDAKWPEEPSPEYQQRAMAMLQDEMARREKKAHKPPSQMEVTGPIFMFDPNERTMTVVDQTPTPYQRDASDEVAYASDEREVALNPNDPFEAALIDIVTMNRRKRADYAYDGDPFSNFKETAKMMGGSWTAADSAHFNIAQKMARLAALRSNGRMNDPANESVTDTRLDLAVYAIIAYAIHKSGNS